MSWLVAHSGLCYEEHIRLQSVTSLLVVVFPSVPKLPGSLRSHGGKRNLGGHESERLRRLSAARKTPR